MTSHLWSATLRDRRGEKVIFLSHCLLNENTRYLGGAPRSGPVPEIVRACVDRGIGIVQLPCPEAHAWGGVLKRRLLAFFGARGTVRYRVGIALLPVMLLYTRAVYRRLAREAARQMRDLVESGIDVIGIVGIDASPSCGVNLTLQIRRSLEALGALRDDATGSEVNDIVRAAVVGGEGLFVTSLRRQLARLGMTVPFGAHDLLRELDGLPSSFDLSSLRNDG